LKIVLNLAQREHN